MFIIMFVPLHKHKIVSLNYLWYHFYFILPNFYDENKRYWNSNHLSLQRVVRLLALLESVLLFSSHNVLCMYDPSLIPVIGTNIIIYNMTIFVLDAFPVINIYSNNKSKPWI